MKTTKTYTIISIDKNVAGILVNGVVTGTIQTDMQGTSVAFNMSAKNKAEMVVDITTGLVSKVTNESDVTGNMDLMGQSMPVTSKVTTTIIYQY